MDLNPYRRHTPDCKPGQEKGIAYIACKCPIWVYGKASNGEPVRQSLKTRDWSRGLRRVEQLDQALSNPAPIAPAPHQPKSDITAAVSGYLENCRRRKLTEATVTSYTKTLEAFAVHAIGQGIDSTAGLRLAVFESFHSRRSHVTAHTQRKEIEHLRSWCAYLVKQGAIASNFARDVAPPKEERPVTLPFDRHETARLIAACDRVGQVWTAGYGGAYRTLEEVAEERLYARALVLLLLYSGLRISDAIGLRRARLNLKTGKLVMRQMKTKTNLYLALHPDAIAALRALPAAGDFFFWYQGSGRLESSVERARQLIRRIATAAGVTDAHPHRFRDTFAKELLANGVSIRTVQLLLGHTSLRTTEEHYAAFVPEYQAALDSAAKVLQFVA